MPRPTVARYWLRRHDLPPLSGVARCFFLFNTLSIFNISSTARVGAGRVRAAGLVDSPVIVRPFGPKAKECSAGIKGQNKRGYARGCGRMVPAHAPKTVMRSRPPQHWPFRISCRSSRTKLCGRAVVQGDVPRRPQLSSSQAARGRPLLRPKIGPDQQIARIMAQPERRDAPVVRR